jgi:hypothetical protein
VRQKEIVMGWFRNRELEERLQRMDAYVAELRGEVMELRAACTMRVGDPNPYSYRDVRPVMTAIQAVQTLMAHAGIEPKPVEPVCAGVQFVQAKPE